MITTEEELKKRENWGLAALEQVREARRRHQQATAEKRSRWIDANEYFYSRIKRLLQFIVPPNSRVLELRCETGQFLAALCPSHGLGFEISDAMVACARNAHPHLQFLRADPEELDLGDQFDYILFD